MHGKQQKEGVRIYKQGVLKMLPLVLTSFLVFIMDTRSNGLAGNHKISE